MAATASPSTTTPGHASTIDTPAIDALVSPGPAATTSTAAATWALFLGLGLLMVGNGLSGTLIGIRSELEGFDTVVSGLIMTGYFVGFLAGSHFVRSALGRVGHIRVFAAMASLASASVLIHSVTTQPATWFFMRAATGFCMAGLFVVVESWLNELATNETRGRMLATYMVVSIGSMAGGQLLVGLTSPLTVTLFVVSSVLVSASLVPVTLSATSTPPPIRSVPTVKVRELASVVPTGVVVSLLGGVGAGVLIGMSAIYATSIGMAPARIAIFTAAPLVGGVIFQWPIGLLSDRFSRRAIILLVAIGAAVAAGAATLAAGGSNQAVLWMFVLGGLLFPLYSLGLAYSNDWLTPEQRLGGASTLIAINGSGAVIGPVLAAVLMSRWGAQQFFTLLIGTHLLMAALVAVRIVIGDPPPNEDEHYVAFPTRGTAMAAQLWLRRRRPRAKGSS